MKPERLLFLFFIIYLIVGASIVRDFGFTPDERVEKSRAMIALSRYGVDIGTLSRDYEDLGHSQYYGTATSMLLVWADLVAADRFGLPSGLAMHYGYFVTFLIAALALFYLSRLFVGPWIALYTTVLFATQPLIFGHAFINPKDIPLLAFFLATVGIGFYVDRHPAWAQGAQVVIRGPDLAIHWRRFLRSRPRSVFVLGLSLIAILMMAAALRPALSGLVTRIITTAYADPGSFWGKVLSRLADNLNATPLEAYVAKGLANLNRLLKTLFLGAGLGLAALAGAVTWDGHRRLPPRLREQSIIQALLTHLKNPYLIVGAVVLGFAVATRILAVFAGGLVSIYLLWGYRRKAILPLAVFIVISTVSAYLFWPLFWEQGPSALFNALSLFSNFDPYFGFIHFRGQIFREFEVPRTYLPYLFSVQFTETLVVLAISGLFLWGTAGFKASSMPAASRKQLLLIFLWFFLPLVYVLVISPILYNNFRQFLFITPPLFIFAGFAVRSLLNRFNRGPIIPAILCLALLPGISSLFSLHPYQYVYYNQFIGGMKGAFRNYDLDYWYTSLKEAMDYVNAAAPESARVLVWDEEYSLAVLYNRPDIEIGRVAHVPEAEYTSYQLAVIPTTRNHDQRVPETWLPVKRISRDGAILAVVFLIDGQIP